MSSVLVQYCTGTQSRVMNDIKSMSQLRSDNINLVLKNQELKAEIKSLDEKYDNEIKLKEKTVENKDAQNKRLELYLNSDVEKSKSITEDFEKL